MVVVLWRAGLRAAELVALRPKDLDPHTGTIRVLRGKGDRSRTVALDPEALAVVGLWAQTREGLAVKRSSPLFCTLRGRPLQTSYLRQMLPRLAARAGIAKRVHPHALRHTFTVELAREGTPIHVVQAALGHANVATTSRYIAHLEDPELVDALRSRPSWAEAGAAQSSPAPGRVRLRARIRSA